MPAKLNERQRRFIEAYLVTGHIGKAAQEAGYSSKTAHQIGSALLKKVEIQQALADRRALLAANTAVTPERVIEELAVIGFSDARHYALGDAGGLELAKDAPDAAMRGVASVKHRTRTDEDGNSTHEVEYRLWDKNTALANIGKHLGMFVERSEVEVKGPVKIEVRFVRESRKRTAS